MTAHSMLFYIIPVMSIVGLLLSSAMPNTSELTSPRFLMIYSWTLMTLLVGCWLSFKGRIPIPLWAPATMLINAAVVLPLIKVYFS